LGPKLTLTTRPTERKLIKNRNTGKELSLIQGEKEERYLEQ